MIYTITNQDELESLSQEESGVALSPYFWLVSASTLYIALILAPYSDINYPFIGAYPDIQINMWHTWVRLVELHEGFETKVI